MTNSDQTPGQPNAPIPQHSGLANQLRGLWTTMTGQAQILTGAQWGDAELLFSGIVTALQGRLQTAIGEQQAQVASDALRTEWSGLNEETKGKILRQWGAWRDDPQAMANGVVDLMQGKLDRYVGAQARQAGTPVSDAALAVGDQAADQLRQALTVYFAGNAA
jgi:uncharacterized protein YjbJ (UPF0337 family)